MTRCTGRRIDDQHLCVWEDCSSVMPDKLVENVSSSSRNRKPLIFSIARRYSGSEQAVITGYKSAKATTVREKRSSKSRK